MPREHFHNCSLPESTCEDPVDLPIFQGSVGVCDNVTNLCICQPGYNGVDFYATYNDCHINKNVILIIDSATLGLLVLGGFVTIISILRLLCIWEIIYWKSDEEYFTTTDSNNDKRKSRSSLRATPAQEGPPNTGLMISLDTIPLQTAAVTGNEIIQSSPVPANPKKRMSFHQMVPIVDMAELQNPKPNARTNTFQQMLAERKRRRNTLRLLVVWTCFCISGAIFLIYRVSGIPLERHDPFMLFNLACVTSSSICGLWLITHTWYSNVPSLRLFANMFPAIRDSFLVKYPTAFRTFAIINCTFACLCSFLMFFIVPISVGTLIPGLLLIRIGLVLYAFQFMFFVVTHCMVSVILLKLFQSFNKTRGNYTSFGENTVKIMIVLMSMAGPFISAWVICMAFVPVTFRYYFFFFSALFVAGSIAACIVSYIFVFRMGTKKKGSRSRSGSSVQRSKRASVGEVLAPVTE